MLAALAFVLVNILIVRRQQAAHAAVLLVGALAWLVGSVAVATGSGEPSAIAWGFAFLVATISAERLEMARPMRRRPGTQATLFAGGVRLARGGGAATSLTAIKCDRSRALQDRRMMDRYDIALVSTSWRRFRDRYTDGVIS